MPGRFPATVVAVLTLAAVCATSARAIEIGFDGEVLRYRAQPGEGSNVVVRLKASAEPRHLQIRADRAVTFNLGPGCNSPVWDPTSVVQCPLVSRQSEPRYRFNVGSTSTWTRFFGNLHGVVYGGSGYDVVSGGDQVYGGPGGDVLDGANVYGGPGHDTVSGSSTVTNPVLRGGPGNDDLLSPGWLYAGPGSDSLQELDRPRTTDMLVGGPGQDVLYLESDNRGDVVRVRGGGVDHVDCDPDPDPGDALFVDRSDRLSPSCKDATVLYTERPRFPYP